MDNSTNGIDTGNPFAEERTVSTGPSKAIVPAPKKNKQPVSSLEEQVVLLFTPQEGGWFYRAATEIDSTFFVHHRAKNLCYIVNLATNPAESFCTCRDFTNRRQCVHLLAMQAEMAFLAWVEEQEQLQADAEHPCHGCDPNMHYDRAGNPDAEC